MTAAVLRFPKDRLASFACSFGANATATFRVVGTEGDIRLDSAFEYAEPHRMTVTIGEKKREKEFPQRDQFGAEIEYFSDCVLLRKSPEPSGREGLADVRIIRALLESARSGKPVRLEEFDKRARPTPRQEIRKAAVEEPELVGVESGSRD
jgi:glucose-fructose oxidoreductase